MLFQFISPYSYEVLIHFLSSFGCFGSFGSFGCFACFACFALPVRAALACVVPAHLPSENRRQATVLSSRNQENVSLKINVYQ